LLEVVTLTDGGQDAASIAQRLAAFLGGAERTLDLALYDLRLDPPVSDVVVGALREADGRDVGVRIAYNTDHRNPIPVPPPPEAVPDDIEGLPFPTKAISGIPDLMHHKYVVRDGESVWTGSMNWTTDSWTRQENAIVTLASAQIAADYARDFEELWQTRSVEASGPKTKAADVDGVPVQAWFSPKRGEALAQRIASRIAKARRRVRIASPVITSAPILGTLAEVVSDGRLDVAGVVDATQMREVFSQWRENGNAAWKLPLVARVLEGAPFAGKQSTPWGTGTVHDFMHAKVTVADDTVFVGSFNLSHSGEQNAENVLEIRDAALVERLATYIDGVRASYPAFAGPRDGM
jgi:phosphatidylserine/phosphatidylglycerophosphate/cardiolipin synthase-like enzyme